MIIVLLYLMRGLYQDEAGWHYLVTVEPAPSYLVCAIVVAHAELPALCEVEYLL